MNNSSTSPAGASPVVFTGSVPSVFSNEEFGSVRVIVKDDGEPLFCGKDVATCLGYSDQAQAVRDHVDEEDKGVVKITTPGGNQDVTFITESGLYSLILGSKLESAKKFKRWLTSEILPSIRKTGSYSVACPSYQIEDPIARAQKWIEEEKVRIELHDKNNEQRHVIKQQSDMIDVMLPKAKAWEDEMSTAGWYSGSVAAKII